MGYSDLIKKKTLENYLKGKITFSEAAKQSELTILEMEEYIVEQGYESKYSIEDLEKEKGY